MRYARGVARGGQHQPSVNCTSCGSSNVPGSRFCEQCGAALEQACASCGSPISAGARFCRSCGTPVAQGDAPGAAAAAAQPTTGQLPAPQAHPAAATERRLVTVLFADLVGFTSLAEDRDPETTRELLTRYFDAARDAIERHGGTVEKFIGDAVMAVWGTPVAHEDDAERAVRAALELVDAVRGLAPQLQARAGLMTGEAAVTLGATNQGMVAGDLVNTAARLQGVADPGTVLAGEATVRSAEAAIVFGPVGEQDLKGKLTPVPAWRAARIVATRGGSMRNDALEPPFVGRDDELRLLKEQLHATGRDQRTKLVSITGPGGIGKSRLVWELEKYLDGLTEPIYWHRGRSPSYGDGIAFWALGEMVRRRAQLTEEDDEPTTRARIAATVEQYVADPAERELVEPALLTLLGVGRDDGAATDSGRDRLFPAWRIFFERIAERGTTTLVFEDLHWADSGLLDFIDYLLDWSKSRPLLVITLARPELFDRRPDWGSGRRFMTALALEPLPEAAMRQLLEGVVPGLPEQAVDNIVRRAEGIPLYAVETVRMLLADGRIERDGEAFRPVGDLADLADLKAPESLRALIASRLDGLDSADRALLQDASVLGQVFSPTSLAVVIGASEVELEPRLRSLMRRELLEVEADPQSPERGQYRFVQALIREVAYGTLAMRDRRARHLAVARHFESLGDEEMAGALASHYLAAFEASAEGPEADAVRTQARIALRAAAERATSLGAQAQALAHLQRALEITDDAADRAELLERAAQAALHAGSGDATTLARGAVDARRDAADEAGADRATALLGQVLIDRGELDAAVEVLEAALADESREREPQAEAELQVALSRVYMRLGRDDEALERAERALTLAERHKLERVLADGLNSRASVIDRQGRHREAKALEQTAIEIAAANGWSDLQLRLMNNLMVIGFESETSGTLADIAQEMIDLARRIGSRPWYTRGVSMWAGAAIQIPDSWDAVVEGVDELLSQVGPTEIPELLGRLILFQAARGVPAAELTRRLEAVRTDSHAIAFRYSILAHLNLIAGDWPTAERHARAALEADETGEATPWALSLLSHVALRQGDAEKARAVAVAMRERQEGGEFSLADTEQAEAGVAALEGRTRDAVALYGRAFERWSKLGAMHDQVFGLLTAIRLLPSVPEAAGWAAQARDFCERARATALLHQLEELEAAMPAAPKLPSRVGAPPGVPSTAS
jgi:class 3 adenylate cyclase/predicted ATPase